ncbi:MAG: NAD-dependent epimerase/dehydratase family protein [Pseudomonadota bacterium]
MKDQHSEPVTAPLAPRETVPHVSTTAAHELSRAVPAQGLITIFGGSGFLGRHMVRALAGAGYRVKAAVRRPDLAGHLQPMGFPGQVQAVQANLRYPQTVAKAIEGADGVINLVGLLDQSGKQRFDTVHVDGARAVAAAAAQAGVKAFTQVSAIGADPASDAQYAKTKAQGEQAILEAFPEAVILRPSIVFGPEDEFFNRFAAMARFSPALPLIGGGKTLFQPVYVGDVAEAAHAAMTGQARAGTIYELGGPEIFSFRALLERMLDYIERDRMLVSLPFWLAKLQATLVSPLPNRPITVDQVKMLKHDNVVSAAAVAEGRTLAGLGVDDLSSVDMIVPDYMDQYHEKGQYARYAG